jgi:hypothetical protein
MIPEIVSIFKEIQTGPQKIFEIIRFDVRQMVGKYLSEMDKTACIPSKNRHQWFKPVHKDLPPHKTTAEELWLRYAFSASGCPRAANGALLSRSSQDPHW